MNWRIILTVLRKELRETLRDRRTLIIMIVIPVLLYPGMMVIIEQLALMGQRSLADVQVRVAVVGSAPPVTERLEAHPAVRLVYWEGVDHDMLHAGRVDAVLVLPQEGWTVTGTNRVGILFDGTREHSAYARGLLTQQLGAVRDSLVAARLARQALPPELVRPIAVDDTSLASPQQVGGYVLGRFLPLILILMTVLGAFYPAIDLAAGEKERGTLETLLTAPVPADSLVTGKFAAAALMGFTAATLNLVSMLLTFQMGLVQFAQVADIRFEIPAGSILVIFAVLVLLAVLFAALFLGIAVRAHSFKEAQNSLTPVYILSVLPALLPMMPGIEFTAGFALIPVAGVAFLFRDLMTGLPLQLPAVMAVAATVFYTSLALIFAARSFGREDVLFGSGGGTIRMGSLGARLRAWRAEGRGVPRVGEALLLATVVALLFFYASRPLMLGLGETGILASQWLLLALPALLFAWLGPYSVRGTLALRRPPPHALPAALLIVAGGIPIGWLLAWLQTFVIPIPVEFLRAMEQLLTAPDAGRILWLLVLVALTPAICEELVFRGVLLQSFAREMKMWQAVALSALIFGAFHLSFETVIRFLPTAWLGALLAYVVWHTRSLYPGMLMHFVNNGLAVVALASPWLRERLTDPQGEPPWLLVALAPLLLAAGLKLLPKRPVALPPAAAPTAGPGLTPPLPRREEIAS